MTILRGDLGEADVKFRRKNFSLDVDEVSVLNNAKLEAVNVLGQRFIKLTVQPGWKWSNDIKPVLGTDSC